MYIPLTSHSLRRSVISSSDRLKTLTLSPLLDRINILHEYAVRTEAIPIPRRNETPKLGDLWKEVSKCQEGWGIRRLSDTDLFILMEKQKNEGKKNKKNIKRKKERKIIFGPPECNLLVFSQLSINPSKNYHHAPSHKATTKTESSPAKQTQQA